MIEEPPKVDSTEFKRALGLWPSGVTVVTTRVDGLIYCMTASSFSSLSLDPLKIVVCVALNASIYDFLLKSRVFAVNILRDDQRGLGEAFAKTGREPMAELDLVDTFPGPTGSPIFSPCLAYLDCRLSAIYEGGDHSVFIGDVQEVGSDESAKPLIYFNRSYRAVGDIEE